MLISIFSILSACVLFIIIFVYFASKRKFNYWRKKNIPYLEPTAIVGNYGPYLLQREHFGGVAQRLCSTFPNKDLVGTFFGTEPTLLVKNPEIIKLITTKDFQYFSSREVMDHADREPMGRGIFFTYGNRWKAIRQNLMPFFTSAKMKNMFYLVQKCAYQLESLLDYEINVSDVVEINNLMDRFTMDCVGSCGFGVEINTMGKDVNNPFRVLGPTILGSSTSRAAAKVARSIWPSLFYGLGFRSYPAEISNFFYRLLTGVFEQRQYKPSTRNDFIDLLLTLKEQKYITGDGTEKTVNQEGRVEVDDELLVGQSITLFVAGFETSSNVLSFVLFELAKNPESQERVLEEVDAYLSRHEFQLDYDCVTEMPFLEACLAETMRLYPALDVITREVVEDYTLPSGLKLDRGLHIHIPVFYLHHNPDYFPNPEQFRPERFLPEEKVSIKPYTYLPYGEGPRICMGIRFGKMQMIAGLITLLKKYQVSLAEGQSTRVEFDPKTPNLQPKGYMRLKLSPRDGWEHRVFVK